MTTATLPRQTIHWFVLAAVSTAALVMIVGWFTDVRQLLHWILLSLAVTAFLPFVIIGGGLAIGLVLFLIGAVLGGDAPLLFDYRDLTLDDGLWVITWNNTHECRCQARDRVRPGCKWKFNRFWL